MAKTITYLQNKDLFIYSTDDYLSYDEVKAIQAGYESQLCSKVAVIPMCSSFQVIGSEYNGGRVSPASTELLLSIMEADKELKAGDEKDKAISIQPYSQEEVDSALIAYYKITGAHYCAIIMACGEQYLIVSPRHDSNN